jgi:hypothetical protein
MRRRSAAAWSRLSKIKRWVGSVLESAASPRLPLNWWREIRLAHLEPGIHLEQPW